MLEVGKLGDLRRPVRWVGSPENAGHGEIDGEEIGEEPVPPDS